MSAKKQPISSKKQPSVGKNTASSAPKNHSKHYFKKRYYDTKSVAFLLPKHLKNSTQKRGFSEGQLILQWAKICPEYAHVSTPETLSHARVLRLAVASDSVKQEIAMASPQIIANLNLWLGYEAIHKIAFITRAFAPPAKKIGHKKTPSPLAVEKAKKTCNTIKNDTTLRDALTRLGALIYDANKK